MTMCCGGALFGPAGIINCWWPIVLVAVPPAPDGKTVKVACDPDPADPAPVGAWLAKGSEDTDKLLPPALLTNCACAWVLCVTVVVVNDRTPVEAEAGMDS